MERLKRRTDFRAVAQGMRAPSGAFVLQARLRAEAAQDGSQDGGQDAGKETVQNNGRIRVGFTVSRQVGNAVERNRVRRRLREVVRLAQDGGRGAAFRGGHDYVLIGRRSALGAPFADLSGQFDAALRRIHAAGRSGPNKVTEGAAAATGAGADTPPHKAGSPGKRRAQHGPRHQPPRTHGKPEHKSR
ncbi:MAG: ribonuclease P protein component [Xanthobacteraceae bacterium]